MSISVHYNANLQMTLINQVCPNKRKLLGIIEARDGEIVAYRGEDDCSCCDSIVFPATKESHRLNLFTAQLGMRLELDDNVLGRDAPRLENWVDSLSDNVFVEIGDAEFGMIKGLAKSMELGENEGTPYSGESRGEFGNNVAEFSTLSNITRIG